MTTNAPDKVRDSYDSAESESSPSKVRRAVTAVRTSRPAQAATTHRKPLAATVLALAAAAAAATAILRKRAAKPRRSAWRPGFLSR
ncbi:hypothetical protein ACWT_2265 [Actinoplanes sp. SE50]|nr:hypothetical protein ACPL_2392 [Actinoplanes sp. SE50/110]ATO81680.1 hypothetical protein ACWT_2265 [Actinoplanes sp. SE50]SLL99088.1 hypothetical protein ACSP50_2319 [Actinoplanes sp. SE50/110]